jgi:hypothetical protein
VLRCNIRTEPASRRFRTENTHAPPGNRIFGHILCAIIHNWTASAAAFLGTPWAWSRAAASTDMRVIACAFSGNRLSFPDLRPDLLCFVIGVPVRGVRNLCMPLPCERARLKPGASSRSSKSNRVSCTIRRSAPRFTSWCADRVTATYVFSHDEAVAAASPMKLLLDQGNFSKRNSLRRSTARRHSHPREGHRSRPCIGAHRMIFREDVWISRAHRV